MESLVKLAAGLLKHLGFWQFTGFCAYCIRFDNEDHERSVPICSVGSVAVWY